MAEPHAAEVTWRVRTEKSHKGKPPIIFMRGQYLICTEFDDLKRGTETNGYGTMSFTRTWVPITELETMTLTVVRPYVVLVIMSQLIIKLNY